MGPLQIVLGTLAVLLLVVSVVYATKAVRAMLRIFKTGQPDRTRNGPVGARLKTLAVESLGHTRMLKWSAIGAAHWFVFLGFYGLFLTLVEAFGEVWNPKWHLPLIGEWSLWNLFVDVIGTGTVLGIVYLIIRRQVDHPRRKGRDLVRLVREQPLAEDPAARGADVHVGGQHARHAEAL